MKRKIFIVIGILILILTFLLGLVSQFIPLKAVYHAEPSEGDVFLFPYQIVEKSTTPFQFHRSSKNWEKHLKFNDWMTDLPVYKCIDDAVRDHATDACLVIQRDTILYEYYGEDKDEKSLFPSYSIAKSMLSALIGFAIQDGFIQSEEELVAQYLPEIKGKKYSDSLTLRHLLNMTSGLQYALEMDAELYYGEDISETFTRIKFEHKPGKVQAYLNINAQMLGIILQRSTGKTPSEYLEEQMWKPLGMEADAWWSTDETGEMVKTYCCLNATARDFARFGRLFLHRGTWEGAQILNENWIAKSIARDTTGGSSEGYNYNWHIGLKEYGDFMAVGLYKQYLYINPKKDLIILVLNGREDKLKAERTNWPYILRQIADQL